MIRVCVLAAVFAMLAGQAVADPVRVTGETADQALLAEIERELAGGDAPETLFEGRRLARRAAERALGYLNSIGYFSAEVSHAVEPGPPIQPMIRVEPGPRFSIGDISIDLRDVVLAPADQAAIDEAGVLGAGDVAIPKDIIAQEAGYLAVLKSLGYADARALKRRSLGDREAATLDIVYLLRPGPKVRFGEVKFDDGVRTRRVYLEQIIPFEPGETYSPEALSTFNTRLSETRLYDVSSARLDEEPAQVAADGSVVRDVAVTLIERDRYTLSAGTSISTSEGPGLTTSLTRRNATRRGDTLTGTVTLAAQRRALVADWRIPNAVDYNKALAFTADVGREETDAFDRDAIMVSGAYEVQRSARLTYSLGAESEFTSEQDAFSERDLQILSVSAGARLDRSDNPIDPVRGWKTDVRVEPAVALGDTTSQFFTVNGQVSAYSPLFNDDRFVAAARLRSGLVYGADTVDLPVSRRFFAGGGGSARGFAYQSVGPEDVDGTPTGGRGLLEVSAELRWRREGRLGYVAFLDGANVSNGQSPGLSDLRYSAGLGVRYQTAIGPIRLDIATPLDRESGDDPLQVYVSLGQAF